MITSELPAQNMLNELLSYDADTGALAWKARGLHLFSSGSRPAEVMRATWNSRYSGKPALACMTVNGYLKGSIFDRRYLAHRVIWKMVYGEEPDHIDHINHKRSDNRLCNLSNVNHVGNSRNMAMRSSNSSGFTGVHWDNASGKWIARIGVNSKTLWIGCFDDKRAAIQARKNANLQHGYHENHGRQVTEVRND